MAVKASNQISVIDLTDAYSVVLTNEAYTFLGDTDSVSNTQTTTTVVQAIQGDTIVPCSVGTITCPTGLSAVSDGKSPSPTITITATSALTSGGSIMIPVTIGDLTINKLFSYQIAFTGKQGATGQAGKGIKSTAITYQVGTSGSTAPTGTWSSTPVATTAQGQFLWTRTITTYTDNTSTTAYSVAAHGTTGAKGATGATGPQGPQGATGAAGAAGKDAIALMITSSGGFIFKNSDIATTLTAHVYKGGVEVTGTALSSLGTIKWYKDSGTTAVASGVTLTIKAGDVTSKANYTAQLEG